MTNSLNSRTHVALNMYNHQYEQVIPATWLPNLTTKEFYKSATCTSVYIYTEIHQEICNTFAGVLIFTSKHMQTCQTCTNLNLKTTWSAPLP